MGHLAAEVDEALLLLDGADTGLGVYLDRKAENATFAAEMRAEYEDENAAIAAEMRAEYEDENAAIAAEMRAEYEAEMRADYSE